jgi:hypothetical protein
MATELLWKRAVRRGIESARREPNHCDFRSACELSNWLLENLHRELSGGQPLSQAELNRRVSRHLIELEAIERRMAESWRTVWVTK